MSNTRRRKNISYYPRQRKQRNSQITAGQGMPGQGRGNRRGKVIAVVGAGGKSTYIDNNSRKLVREGRTVAVTTTTHIYNPCVVYGLHSDWDGDEKKPVIRLGGVDYYGIPREDGKLSPVSPEAFRDLCRRYDYVFAEADGSHGMPAKIPFGNEPVIPKEADSVVVVMGRAAVGRSPLAVCQHYRQVYDRWIPENTLLTEDHLREIALNYYIRPIRATHPEVKMSYVLSDLYRFGDGGDVADVTFVLMASGFGRRYSCVKNKLLEEYSGEKLFQYALNSMILAAKILRQYHLNLNIDVVTRYPEIMDFTASKHLPNLKAFYNGQAKEGITSSIRIGTRAALAARTQAVVFFAADMPFLAPEETARFVREFICSGKTYGCMAYRNEKEVTKTVPGAFRLTRYGVAGDILSIRGDHGAMKIIRKRPWDTYLYYIERRFVEDIDYQL